MVKVHYFFDPMCGWCYGASSLIAVLADMPEFEVVYHPGGMIPKRAIDPSFRHHILQADKQIADRTQVHFGEAYKARVAGEGEFVIDSYLPTQAFLVGIEMGIAPHLMLKAIQAAHYQDGRELDKPEALQTLAVSLGLDEATWQAKMASSAAVMMSEIERSHELMGPLQVNGYPTILIEKKGKLQRLTHSAYYGKPDEWKGYLSTLG
jgi:putative protein-disulfide isomerase